MFFICVLALCILEFSNSHLMDNGAYAQSVIMQAELVLVLGAAVFSKNTMPERSVIDIIFLWAMWILLTDWLPYFPPILASIETGIFFAMLAYVYFRPYRFIQTPIKTENVCIAFYGGPNAPFLSRLASHVGFPFSSVALVVNGVVVRPSKATGAMVESTSTVLKDKGYVLIDTGIKSTPEIYGKMKSIVGTNTSNGLLRTKCLKNMTPVLECLGREWQPKGWPVIPSLYYKKCVRNVT